MLNGDSLPVCLYLTELATELISSKTKGNDCHRCGNYAKHGAVIVIGTVNSDSDGRNRLDINESFDIHRHLKLCLKCRQLLASRIDECVNEVIPPSENAQEASPDPMGLTMKPEAIAH